MHILIAGDSWSQGEWGMNLQSRYTVLHSGLTQYLQDDGHMVTNIGAGGDTNLNQVKLIQDSLQTDLYDIVIWFQTDPLRERWHAVRENSKQFWLGIDSLDDFLTLEQTLLDNNYMQLNETNEKIYCIGGCFSINLELIKKYNNLIPVIEYLPTWIIPDQVFPRCINPIWRTIGITSRDENFLKFLADDNLNYKNYLSEYKNKSSPMIEKYFRPDGGHMNRYGHLKLYDYMKEKGIF